MSRLKLDIKKFFASVDHEILLGLLRRKIKDEKVLWLLFQVIDSFYSGYGHDKGIPLGHLTSQVFANIYLNELDQFMKQGLRMKYYIRYADDFILLFCSNDLNQWIKNIEQFLWNQLKLKLHPKKIILKKLDWGIDFLGYVILPHYLLPRTKTKRRIFKKLAVKLGSENFNQSLQSYLGYLSHANAYKVEQILKNQFMMRPTCWTGR